MKNEFWSDWARYKGKEYKYVSYGFGGKIELFDVDDISKKYVLYTVTADELEDRYTLIVHAIINGIEYVVYDIENDIVTYKKYVNDTEFIKRTQTEFELIFSQKNHKNSVEKEIIYIDEKRIDKEAVNRRFWPEEMACGNIMFSAMDDLISINDLNEALNEIYGARISDRGGIIEALLWDEYVAWLRIDGEKFNISSDWGIMSISPDDENGNKYIMEIVEYFNR